MRRVPQNMVGLIAEAQNLRLYLINQNGPTSFAYCDDDQRKFKITIGDTIFCSCNSTGQGHCVHTLHAMIKKFRVDPDNPIIWQDGYSDSEVSDLIAGKFSIRKQPPTLPVHDQHPEQSQQQSQQSQIVSQHANRQDINEDSLCPICQEQMSQNEPLTYCKMMCGSNFHIKCLKIWVEQKQGNVTCPMCRQSLGQNAKGDIIKEEYEFANKAQTHLVQCKGCSVKPIIGGIYQCIHCKSQTVCQKCFQKQHHQEHNEYFHRVRTDEEWRPFRRNSTNRIEQGQSIKQFIESCFQSDDMTSHQNQNLLIIGSLMSSEKKKCDICLQSNMTNKNSGKISLKRLKCGHLIDAICFRKLEENHYVCPLDGIIQMEGYIKITGVKINSTISVKSNNHEEDQKAKLKGITRPPLKQMRQLELVQPVNHNAQLMVISVSVQNPVNRQTVKQKLINGEKTSQNRLASLQHKVFQPILDLNVFGIGRFEEKTDKKQTSKSNSFKIRRSTTKVKQLSSQESSQIDLLNSLQVQSVKSRQDDQIEQIYEIIPHQVQNDKQNENDQINQNNHEETEEQEIFIPYNQRT